MQRGRRRPDRQDPIARRGNCFFGDKLANAAAAGAIAIVIADNAQDSLWGEARIWDYSDPRTRS